MREITLRLDISSTEVRRRIRRNLSITGMVPMTVEALIRKNRWYR